ncbi:hypothetical protein BDW02DRAFT_268952 [Decorospora gaudefroyi]|uniref:Uncharacterized protein n=1 Tax=Decorospora gaudefroyi TaxID=184978 RepID=A0A6A5KI05_9PLEO|nr:hypothetical protein BDW02DRAFT_268952 [Decorospora gaudefroyi]
MKNGIAAARECDGAFGSSLLFSAPRLDSAITSWPNSVAQWRAVEYQVPFAAHDTTIRIPASHPLSACAWNIRNRTALRTLSGLPAAAYFFPRSRLVEQQLYRTLIIVKWMKRRVIESYTNLAPLSNNDPGSSLRCTFTPHCHNQRYQPFVSM